MNNFAKEEIEKVAKLFIVFTHNLDQEQLFKAGIPCLPKVKDYEEYKKLMDFFNETFKPASNVTKFKEIKDPKIIYNIPERFSHE